MEELKELVDTLYNKILQTTNLALQHCKALSLKELDEKNPSYDQIAEYLTECAAAMDVVCQMTALEGEADSAHKAAKAFEYAIDIKNIAKAIRAQDEKRLKLYVDELDGRPFL